MDRSRRLLLAVATVAAALVLLLPLILFSNGGSGALPLPASKQRTVSILVGVEGMGAVAVNGSEALGPVSLPSGSTVKVEAKPAEGWRLKSMLVNGTPASPPLTLTIRGNTTVRAVFERAPVEVRVEVAGPGRVVVNGSVVASNSTVEAVPGGMLLVRLRPADCYSGILLVDGRRVEPAGDALDPDLYEVPVEGAMTLRAVFARANITLEVDTKGLPALLRGDGWEKLVNGTARLTIKACTAVNVTTWKVVAGGNETFIVQWNYTEAGKSKLIPSSEQLKPFPANTTVYPSSDARLEAVVASHKIVNLTATKGEIIFNGKPVPAVATIYKYTRSKPKISYQGNGEWLVVGGAISTFYIQMPEGWKTVKVSVCSQGGVYLDVSVILVNREGAVPPYQAQGTILIDGGGCNYVVLSREGVVLERGDNGNSRISTYR